MAEKKPPMIAPAFGRRIDFHEFHAAAKRSQDVDAATEKAVVADLPVTEQAEKGDDNG